MRLRHATVYSSTQILSADDQKSLTEREHLIEARIDAVLDRARTTAAPWITSLPATEDELGLQSLRVIAAYRGSDHPL